MCKCKQDRELAEKLAQELIMRSSQVNAYTSFIMDKNSFENPTYLRYNGTGGTRPFIGSKTRNRYMFGADNRTGWVENSDAVEFLTRKSGGVNLFSIEPEPVVTTQDVTVNKLEDAQLVEEIVAEMAVIEPEPVIEVVEEPKKRTKRTKKTE